MMIFKDVCEKDVEKSLLALIGIVFFSTISSMMILTTLPAFFKENLHLSDHQIGWIEGVSALIVSLSKFAAGYLSDRFSQRKSIIVVGTFLSCVAKGCLALATGFVSVFLFRIVDRLGKGLRSCPSDAMIADLVTIKNRGFFYGLKYTLLMSGGVLGGYVTYKLLGTIGTNFQLIFCLAMIPAFIALFLARRYLSDLNITEIETQLCSENPSFWQTLQNFDPMYWKLLWIVFLLMFGRFSETFIMLKAYSVKCSVESIPFLFSLYDLCAAIEALFFGFISMKISKEKLFKASLLVYALAHVVFCCSFSKSMLIVGGIIAGMHIGMSQGVLLALISKYASSEGRGTAFSLYYVVVGIGQLLSNLLAGTLNNLMHNSSGAFIGGAVFCCLAWSAFPRLSQPDVATFAEKF